MLTNQKLAKSEKKLLRSSNFVIIVFGTLEKNTRVVVALVKAGTASRLGNKGINHAKNSYIAILSFFHVNGL